MATIEKHGPSWRVRLDALPDGRRPSKTFRTQAEARAWLREYQAGELADPSEATLAQVLRRYAAEVSPGHKGERWEVVRLNKLARHPMAATPIQKLTTAALAAWRDERLKQVAPASVRRELGILGSVLDIARREWGLIRTNPLEDVRKPSAPASRKRRVSDAEIERIVTALGYDGGPPQNASHLTALAFMLAIETAMRAGEILGLTWANVRAKAVTLPATKNGDVRDVPLSPRAREIIALLPRDAPTVFDLKAGTRDTMFRKARDRAEVGDLHFHDSRAEAIWRLSKKLPLLDLARVIGHRDLRSLQIYYQINADDLADQL